MKKRILGALAAALCLQGAHGAAPDTNTLVDMTGFAFYQVGQIERADVSGQPYDKALEQCYGIRLEMDARVRARLRIIVGGEFTMWSVAGANFTQPPTAIVIPKEGQGIYTFGDDPASPNPPLQIALGYFPVKYDPGATNFGEYLLGPRTGTYPQYLITDFDNCRSSVLGVRVSSFSGSSAGALRQDLLFTSEMFVAPYGDFSLSYLIGYKAAKMFDVGGGVCFNRLAPIAPSLTTLPADIVYQNSQPVMDNGDTLRYTKQGVKLMLRASFDPKSLLPPEITSLLGPEDGKLYCESAILGVKNYGDQYNNIWQRNPRMAGFNFPAFRVLDVLSMELEYFNSPYANDLQGFQGSAESTLSPVNGVNRQIYWSIFAKKEIVKGLSLRGLIGKDHYLGYSLDPIGNPAGPALMRGNGTWHYDVKIMCAL